VGRDAYELLRFGRVLEPLGNADGLQHWQQVAYPGGQGWVNLHAEGVHAFSDADFPDWCGWRLIDDDTDSDSRCDSATLVNLILQSEGGASKVRCIEALGKVSGTDVQTRLARTVCKFPTEWEKATVTARWQWLTTDTPPGAGPMAGPYLKPEDFPRFKAHSEALCFWEEANLGIPSKHWHFHPREFIRVFRQCGWLSKDEMFQLFPMTAMRKSAGAWVSEPVPNPSSVVKNYNVELNKACRRYGIVTPLRMAAFYANAMQETMWFHKLHEDNSNTRYWPWDGRGFLQLTWPKNYITYWRFAGKLVSDDLAHRLNVEGSNLLAMESRISSEMRRWRDGIADMRHPASATDSAGAYWAWNKASIDADTEPANVRASKNATGPGNYVYFISQGMGRVAATVNWGNPDEPFSRVNGIVARFQAYDTCEVVLLDTTNFPSAHGEYHPAPQGYKPRHP
jgi:hydroxyethylthiazole kinase